MERGFIYEEEARTWTQYETSVKKEQYEHLGVSLKTGLEEKTIRLRPGGQYVEYTNLSEDLMQRITRKYW